MDPIFKKLNYKNEATIHILNTPASFEAQLLSLDSEITVKRQVGASDEVTFAMLFAITQEELNTAIDKLGPKLKGDATLWACYPKKSSKKYTCEFNRDSGWQAFGKYDLEAVRQVAIDEDWSALRFRKVDFIKSFTRDKQRALTDKGKRR